MYPANTRMLVIIIVSICFKIKQSM